MAQLDHTAAVVLIAGLVGLVSLAFSQLPKRLALPTPALLLLGASLTAQLLPHIAGRVNFTAVQNISSVALLLILFDGGMHIGLRRTRAAIWPISVLGIPATLLTASLLTIFCHFALQMNWSFAAVLGAVLAPTDPAVVFSVLGEQQLKGRITTILEGESGANDPIGISLVLGVLALATGLGTSVEAVVIHFAGDLAIGAVIGGLGGCGVTLLIRHVPLPKPALRPVRTLAAAGVIYGIATLLGGSGFLAVFIAGIVLGDVETPFKEEIAGFHGSIASMGEVVAFVALGITLPIGQVLQDWTWLWGVSAFLVLTLVIRPIAVMALLQKTNIERKERVFIALAGLKGAVPILLAAFAKSSGLTGGNSLYRITFVVVILSVLAQGASLPLLASKLGVDAKSIESDLPLA